MNNVDYTINILKKIEMPYGIYKKDDECGTVFSLLAMQTIDDGDFNGLLKVIQHERFSLPCQINLFNAFFNYDPKNHENLKKAFQLLLEIDYFDFSLIFHDMDRTIIYFNQNFELFPILVNHLKDRKIYHSNVYNYYLLRSSKLKDFKEDMDEYFQRVRKQRIFTHLFYTSPNSISISYNDLDLAFKNIREEYTSDPKEGLRYFYDEEEDYDHNEDIQTLKKQEELRFEKDQHFINSISNEVFKLKDINPDLYSLFPFLGLTQGFLKHSVIKDIKKIKYKKEIHSISGITEKIKYSIFNSYSLNLSDCLEFYLLKENIKLDITEKNEIINIIRSIEYIIEND